MNDNELPKYRGPLGPAPWSAIRMTEQVADELRRAAARNCPACMGLGHFGKDDKGMVHPCHCVNRPPLSELSNSSDS